MDAHVPVPDSVLNPGSAAEAWNVIRLSTSNVERLLGENRLSEIPDQISLCSPALRALPKFAGLPKSQDKVSAQSVRASGVVISLAQASLAGDASTAKIALDQLQDILAETAAAFDPQVVKADIFFCPMHPDFVSENATAVCDKCGMHLSQRRIPYSFVYMPPGETSLQISAFPKDAITAGQETLVKIRLSKRDGAPVTLNELTTVHTQPIHLLVIDPSLNSYFHEHPAPTSTPGEYAFSFKPAADSSYRIFADLVPTSTGIQEYPFVDLPGSRADRPVIDKATLLTSTSGGFHFRLSCDVPDGTTPHARNTCTLHVVVTDPAGKPVTQLQPIMAAFAHLVGFHEDFRTVIHLHPAGSEITNLALRGGPTLDFKFYPPKAGFIRLFIQVQIDRQMIFAPFGLNVAP